MRGRLELLTRGPRLAIVGSRTPSAYGLEQAGRFASALARAGIVVVSGMARGVDQSAHEGALAEGGATIAVLGSGVDRPWPDGRLARRLLREALLLSEFEPGSGPRKHHFPLRNRLISGLSLGVLVVEAAQRSGSLITARWALDQGKEVWALPGRVDQPMARGTHALMREGATPVESPAQMLEDLFGAAGGRGPTGGERAPSLPASALVEALRGETLSADELSRRCAQPIAHVLAELAMLELDGHLRRAPGGLYQLRGSSY